MSGAPPAAPAMALPPPVRQLGALPKPLLPAPGRPENVYVVSGFTETQLSLLKRQVRPRRRVMAHARRARAAAHAQRARLVAARIGGVCVCRCRASPAEWLPSTRQHACARIFISRM
jgi:hypothetical protein